MNNAILKISLLSLFLLVASGINAQPVPWFHPDGTTHYYEAVSTPTGIDWQQAHDEALSNGGHLVTITSAEENEFVFSLIDDEMYWYDRPNGNLDGPWMGGFQVKASHEPDEGWQWINGDDFSYSNWTLTGPNNLNNNENRIHYGSTGSFRSATWNDISEDVSTVYGYVVEYSAPTQTMGLFQYNEEQSLKGYTLFAPQNYTETYLIDNLGREVNSWSSEYTTGQSAYLLENGHLIRTAQTELGPEGRFGAGGYGGRVEEYDWDGNMVWEFDYATDQYHLHHDIAVLPNGNVLMIAFELITEEEAIEAGRDPENIGSGELWPEKIIEVEPTYPRGGNIVWEWHAWDHLIQDFDPTKQNYGVVGDHPELVDVNFGEPEQIAADWLHANALAYNAELDQIIMSVRAFSEFWVIDHSTTTEEAASHSGGNSGMGGDILYRWGNPQAYRAGTEEDRKLFRQHDTYWITPGYPGEGNILIFNNGNGRTGGNYTTVEEIIPPVDAHGHYAIPAPGEAYGPEEPVWMYIAETPSDFYSPIVSGAQRLPNGNTLINHGTKGRFFEVTPTLETVWEYVNPVIASGSLVQGSSFPGSVVTQQNMVFRAYRFTPEFPGFAGKDLAPGSFIELYPTLTPIVTGLTPIAMPIVIPAGGGDLEFDLTLENIGSAPQSFDAWVDLTYEEEEPTTVLRRSFSNFFSGMSLERSGVQYPIPSSYAAGNYTFTLKVGTFPDEVWNESSFDFEKEGTLLAGSTFTPFPVIDAPDIFEEVTIAEMAIATDFAIMGNYPNPFNPVTTIQFSLSQAEFVTLSVFDVSGRLVETLVSGQRQAGNHQVQFNASNLASGVYLYQLEGGSFTISNKMVLVK